MNYQNSHFLKVISRTAVLYIIACLFTAPQVLAAGNTYYVSTTGNDSSVGSISSPWRTISRGISSLTAGDTLFVRGGTYPTFTMSRSGTAGNYITISGYNNERPLINGGTNPIGIRLTNNSYVKIIGFEVTGATGNWSGGITLDECSYVTIEDNRVHDNIAPNITGITIHGSHNQILRNELYNNNYDGIRVSDATSTENEIAYNRAYNHTLSAGNGDGIGCEGGSTYTNIHHNTVYGNSDDGIDTWICTNNTIANNIVYENGGTGDGNGIKAGGNNGSGGIGGKNIVKQNISYGNLADGITSNGSGGNQYFNNVSYNNAEDGFSDGWRNDSPELSTFANNIGYNNGRSDISLSSGMTDSSHNNAWGVMRWNSSQYTTLASFYAASGFDNPNGGVNASFQVDPKFVNPSEHNFNLQATSPLIGKGDPTNPGVMPAIDSPEIGAFEYPTPMSLQNVYTTFSILRYNQYVTLARLKSGDTLYLKNYDSRKLKLLQIFLYDYAKKGNQGFTRKDLSSTSMLLKVTSNLPLNRRYAYVAKFQDRATGVIATKYFVFWVGSSSRPGIIK